MTADSSIITPDVAPGGRNEPPTMVGVRVARFILENLGTLLPFTLACTLIGVVAAFTLPRRYTSSAVIEVGSRSGDESLEQLIVSTHRLIGYSVPLSLRYDSEATIDATNRRDPSTRELTRFIDVSVTTKTASSAHAMLDGMLTAFLRVHSELYAEGLAIQRDQLALLTDAENQLRSQLAADSGGRLELSAALFESHQLTNDTEASLAEFRTPPTRIISRTGEPKLAPARAWMLGSVGWILGLMLGLSRLRLFPRTFRSVSR